MNDFHLKLLIFFLICINNISAYKNHTICPEGQYGEDCELICGCNEWSTSSHCSKFEGRCLDCKFGHFGKNCTDICYPTCKTNLCCEVKLRDLEGKNQKLTIKNSIIEIQIGDIALNILADYNVGDPLTIFNETFEEVLPFENGTDIINFNFTNFIGNGTLYENVKVKFLEQNNLIINLPIILSESNITQNREKTIHGVIGLGFFNTINDELLISKKIKENIASYQKNGNEISIFFGDLFEEEKNYVHKLSYCKSENNDESFFNISCKIQGFGSKSYHDVLQINDTYIQFSLDTPSKFILHNKTAYTDYIKKYYFLEETDNYKFKTKSNISYFCYKTENINRLNEFGFVFNHFYYFFSADNYFSENEEYCENGYSLFLILFSDQIPGLIFGNNFYNETQFTLDNEEKNIYFYSKYVEYFSGEIKSVIIEDLSNKLNPLTGSFIVIGTSLFLNVVAFLVYFYFKRKKELKKLKTI